MLCLSVPNQNGSSLHVGQGHICCECEICLETAYALMSSVASVVGLVNVTHAAAGVTHAAAGVTHAAAGDFESISERWPHNRHGQPCPVGQSYASGL